MGAEGSPTDCPTSVDWQQGPLKSRNPSSCAAPRPRFRFVVGEIAIACKTRDIVSQELLTSACNHWYLVYNCMSHCVRQRLEMSVLETPPIAIHQLHMHPQ